MAHRYIIYLLLLQFISKGIQSQGAAIKAYFHMTGVTGNVEFTTSSGLTTAILNLQGTQAWPIWEIREFPVLTTHDSYNCEDAVLGNRVHDLTTYHNITGPTSDLSVALNGVSVTSGDSAILGRSLLLQNGQERACATIQGDEQVSFATLNGHIAGNIHVRQVGARYAVFTDLITTTSLSAQEAVLQIYNGSVELDLPGAKRQEVSAFPRCQNVTASRFIAELLTVPVAGGDSHSRSFQFLSTSDFDFSSGSLTIGENSDTSCANFHNYQPKTVRAMFSRDGVKGSITFTQENPYKPTQVTVDLQNLQGLAGGYHIHLYPLPYEFTVDTDLCGSASTGGHFNPFLQTTGDTQADYEIGDLSGKFGNLDDETSANATYNDLYLPLFGKHSVVGRSIVIHTKSGDRWICANIGYPGAVTVAKAEFNGDVEGTITFVQEENMPWGDTSVIVEMTDAGTSSETTRNHKYHIHTAPVGDDYLSVSGRCSSTSGHWNPFDVAVTDTSVYTPGCLVNRFACEIGDLNGKYKETIDMAASPSVSRYFYTDDIPLSSAYSVIKKSITIHQQQASGERYVCADIIQKLNPVVTTDSYWHAGPVNDTLEGVIQMSSNSIPSAVSSLHVNLTGLEQVAGGYHIHSLPLNNRQSGDNVCDTTSGHYNPLGASGWGSDESLDKYEIGDISNKFGMLTGQDSYQLQTVDSNLPMSGAYSVMGRSIVIHDSSSRWRCTNTLWDVEAMGGILLQATAEFSGVVEGHITFSQVITAEGESDVNIQVMLWYSDEQQSATWNHNWHVHLATVHDSDCSSTGGHYNPFDVDVGAASYSSSCGLETPRKCELGDMAGKLGKVDIGTKEQPTRYVFNDNFLSLTGQFAVMGKSIVIHAADSGGDRIACADIIPHGSATYTLGYQIPTHFGAFKDDMAAAVRVNVAADDSHNVYVERLMDAGGCTYVQIHFTGLNAVELSQRFDPSTLGSVYYNTAICSSTEVRGQNEVRAYFNMSGVQGFVEFRDEGSGSTQAQIFIDVDLWYQWEIREFPVLTTDGHHCDDKTLGRTMHDLTQFRNVIDGRTANGTQARLSGVPLTVGDNSILGRSLLLQNGQQRACATIQGDEQVSFATLNGHIAGNIHVRRVGARYAVFTDLITTTSPLESQTTLKVYNGEVRSDLPQAQREVIEASGRCKNHRVSSTSVMAEIRNVPIAKGDDMIRSMSYVEPNSFSFDFSQGWVKVGEDPDTSCANFHNYQPKTVRAMFSRDGVKGSITFTQQNPYKPTQVTVDLQNLNRLAGGYHVHLYPLPYEFSTETDLCGSASTGGHFNPFNGLPDGITQEQLEIGDLSAKHGVLDNRQDIRETYMDLYLPLFGKYSIVGRSIVIHALDGSRWICANIEYPSNVTVAKAEFNGDVEGTITFVQEENMPWGDTSVIVEMTDAGASSETTRNHKYHIHTAPVGDDYLSVSGRCSSTAGHWNPFDVAVTDSTVYNPSCMVSRFACEIGDLNGKYNETIDMAASPSVSRYFYTDDIPLSSAYSVIKKSITIHQQQASGERYVCADIIQKLSPVITTEPQWHGPDGTGGVTGSVQISAPALTAHSSQLDVDLNGLARKAGGYHIHVYPLNRQQPGSNVCGTTGGHYNPLEATMWKVGDSLDRYEIGDLSGKFSTLDGKDGYGLWADDTNLPVTGPYSVMGRSVVIHDSSSRWKCSNTVWDTAAMNGSLLGGYAEFSGEVDGYIKLSQVMTADGVSDANVEIMLWYRDSSRRATYKHNWHVHSYSISGTDCTSAGGHYNPFDKNVGSASYSTACGIQTPRKCELGDMSGKLGQLDIGTKEQPTRYVFNDNFLSLTGMFSVLGRSIVIHAENSGSARLTCADIVPSGDLTHTVEYYIKTPLNDENYKDGMTQAIMDEMKIEDDHNLYVEFGDVRGICTAVTVHFTGEKAVQTRQMFKPHEIYGYEPMDVDACDSAAGAAAPSLILGLSVLLVNLLITFLSH